MIDSKERTAPNLSLVERAIIVILASLVSLSGYAYVSLTMNTQEHDRGIRAICTVIILTLIIVAMCIKKRLVFPTSFLTIITLVAYITSISIATNEPSTYLAPLLRWGIYLSVAMYAYCLSNPNKGAELFFTSSAFFYLAAIVIDVVSGRALHINGAARIAGSIGSPIGFASTLFVIAIGIYYFFLRTKKMYLLFLLVGLAIGIVLTGTRSITVALIAGIPLYYILQKGIRIRNLLPTLFITAIALIGFWYIANFTDVGTRLLFISSDLEADSSTLFRLLVLDTVANNLTLGQAFLGLGLGGFPGWFEHQTGIANVAPHFEFIWIFSEGGVIGCILYVIMIACLAISVRNGKKNNLIPSSTYWLTIIYLLCQQTVLQFANPTYFFQAMIPIFFFIGAVINQTGVRNISIVLFKKEARNENALYDNSGF